MFRFYKIKSHPKQLGSVSFGKRNNGKRKKNKKDRRTKQEEEKIRKREKKDMSGAVLFDANRD